MHSHLAVNHLIRKVELDRLHPRDRRPGWLTEMIDELANLFEPISISGQVGYDCQWQNDHWELSMFLGRVEIVGGLDDGLQKPLNFEFDLKPLMAYFTTINRFSWTATPDQHINEQHLRSHMSGLTISGIVADQHFKLNILEQPPLESTAAIQIFADGRVAPKVDLTSDNLWD